MARATKEAEYVSRFSEETGVTEKQIESALLDLTPNRENLLPALQKVQEKLGYIPKEALEFISERFNLPISKIYGVTSFYSQFHFKPQGKHTIKVCEGTACHVNGSSDILRALKKKLGIEVSEVTDDNKFSLETVRCLGCCSLAPVMMVDDEVYGNLTEEKAKKVLEDYK